MASPRVTRRAVGISRRRPVRPGPIACSRYGRGRDPAGRLGGGARRPGRAGADGARPPWWAEWYCGLGPGGRAVVEAEAVTWATQLSTALQWERFERPPVIGGRDDWWACPGARRLTLKGRADVRAIVEGRQALLVVSGGVPSGRLAHRPRVPGAGRRLGARRARHPRSGGGDVAVVRAVPRPRGRRGCAGRRRPGCGVRRGNLGRRHDRATRRTTGVLAGPGARRAPSPTGPARPIRRAGRARSCNPSVRPEARRPPRRARPSPSGTRRRARATHSARRGRRGTSCGTRWPRSCSWPRPPAAPRTRRARPGSH